MRKSFLFIATLLTLSVGVAQAEVITQAAAGYKITALSADNPISGPYQIISITSTVDKLTIQGMQVNRGKCKVAHNYTTKQSEFPKVLEFGQTFKFDSFACPDLLEVTVGTNRGVVAWGFNGFKG